MVEKVNVWIVGTPLFTSRSPRAAKRLYVGRRGWTKAQGQALRFAHKVWAEAVAATSPGRLRVVRLRCRRCGR